MAAPAMEEAGFPLIRAAALMDGSDSSRWKSAMNSFLTAREMMLSGALGRSKTTIPTPSSTVRLSALIERRWDVGGGRNRNRFSADGHLRFDQVPPTSQDRKSTRLNSSHLVSSYAVVCLKKKRSLI